MNQNCHKEFLKSSDFFPEKSGRALQIDEILVETARLGEIHFQVRMVN